MRKRLFYANRGVILLVLAIIGISIFLIYDSIRCSQASKKIRSQVEAFTSETAEAFSFPQDRISDVKNHAYLQVDLEAYLKAVSEDKCKSLLSYYLDNQALREDLVEQVEQIYLMQFVNHNTIASSVTRNLVNMKVKVYRDTATVDAVISNTFEGEGLEILPFTYTDHYEMIYKDGTWQIASYSANFYSELSE